MAPTSATRPATRSDRAHRSVVEVLNASRERFISFVARRVESREVAEEILQAVFLKILETPQFGQAVVRVIQGSSRDFPLNGEDWLHGVIARA